MNFELNYALVGFFLAVVGFAVMTIAYWNTKKELAELIQSHQQRDVEDELKRLHNVVESMRHQLINCREKEVCCKVTPRR